jgi:hypothetical protein
VRDIASVFTKLEHMSRLLARIANTGPIRSKPQPGDLEGDFHGWFDGGAFRDDTGDRTFSFVDGSMATVRVWDVFDITMELPDGSVVDLRERAPRRREVEPVTPSIREAVAACAACGAGIAVGETYTMMDGVAYHLRCAPES